MHSKRLTAVGLDGIEGILICSSDPRASHSRT